MSARTKSSGKSAGKIDIFMLLRGRIAEALRQEGVEVKEDVSSLELAIGTFAPSQILKRFTISDYPFIGARYVSLRDGHIYIVAGETEDKNRVMAYRQNFWLSSFTHRFGMAVGVSPSAWMDSVMVMYSLDHASFDMHSGDLSGVDAEKITRRAYPLKKLKAYCCHWWQKIKG